MTDLHTLTTSTVARLEEIAAQGDLFSKLLPHRGHKIEVGEYGVRDRIINIAVECMDCYEVLIDVDAP